MLDMGYDVSNYTDVDPVFGTLKDFDALIVRAHELGLKVIIDQVLNHCSNQHPVFAQSLTSRTGPKADWYIWVDARPDGTPPCNWLSVFGGPAFTWDARRKQYYMHSFLPQQPDFDYRNPEVVDCMEGVLRFWLDRGLDGFRFDTVNYFYKDALFRNDAADYVVKDYVDGNPYNMERPHMSNAGLFQVRQKGAGNLRRLCAPATNNIAVSDTSSPWGAFCVWAVWWMMGPRAPVMVRAQPWGWDCRVISVMRVRRMVMAS